MTAVAHAPIRLVTCRGACLAGPSRSHHDRLLSVDTDPDVLLELMELAVTWHELDYAHEPVVPPTDWETFAQRHQWTHPARAEQAFLLALDVVRKGGAGAHRGTLLDRGTG